MILQTDSMMRLSNAALKRFVPGELHVTRVCAHSVLILMMRGVLRFREDGQEVSVVPDEYYIQREGLFQEGMPMEGEPPVYFYIEFKGGIYAGSGSGPELRGRYEPNAVRPMLQAISAAYSRHTADRVLLNSYMFRIFSELMRGSPAYSNTGDLLSMVRCYLNAEYASPITLETLGRRFGYHGDYLARLFRQQYGVSVGQYLTSVRMERAPLVGVEFFDAVGSEALADTPQCITRVFRGTARWRSLTVAAQAPGCSFRWFIVGGDPEKIRIKPLTSDGALTTLEVAWHAPYERDGRPSRRVDLACVAVRPDGTVSAPAFVSFRFLANERRFYESDRLVSVDYTAPESGFVYEDPLLTTFKNWRDDYRYDADGTLLGWERHRPGKTEVDHFDARGRRVTESNPDGTPKTVVPVRYFPRQIQGADGLSAPVLELLQMDNGTATAP